MTNPFVGSDHSDTARPPPDEVPPYIPASSQQTAAEMERNLSAYRKFQEKGARARRFGLFPFSYPAVWNSFGVN